MNEATSRDGAAAGVQPEPTRVSISAGLAAWLREHSCSILFTSYQTGRVAAAGLRPDGTISLTLFSFSRALGLDASNTTLWIASLSLLWRLENTLDAGQLEQGRFDRFYQPRIAYLTGDLDIHEVATDGGGRPIFVNTKYSCLATVSATHNFQTVWKPSFISKLLPEDRCHLNGFAMANGEPAYATAVSRSDVVEGWRARRSQGGILIDVKTDRIVAESLSIPHSPRVHGDRIVLLESGRGRIVSIDPNTGAKEDIAFCPGFLRGLALHDGFALVTTSRARDATFQDLPLEDALKERNEEAQCALLIVDLAKRSIVEKITFSGGIRELFAVSVLPGVRLPMIEEPNDPELGWRHTVAAMPERAAQ
jgi:uncharacterized protein (TIGR03032 family)